MDNLFSTSEKIPQLAEQELTRMAEVAMTYRQHAPGNENNKWASAFTSWKRVWMGGALAAALCVMLVVSMTGTPTTSFTPQTQTQAQTQASTQAQSIAAASVDDDPYADISDIAILATLEGF